MGREPGIPVEAILRDDSGNWYSFTQRTTGPGGAPQASL